MRRIAPVFCALVLATTSLAAQSGSMRLTLPSPTAASLGKFGDVPVSLYTGVPDISVPIFTAKGRLLDVPIVLKYHAGGIKVDEIGGWAGIGWSLEAGGSITRTVRGIVDEYSGGYWGTGHNFYASGNWPTPSFALQQNMQDGLVDGEPDQFFFSFGGRSGEFIMGPTSTDPNLKEYQTLPHSKLKIVPTMGGSGVASWVITAEDGTRYTFADVETNTDYSLPSSGSFPTHYGQAYPSTWHLTGIRSVGGDSVTITYTPFTARHRSQTSREKFDFSSGADGPCRPDVLDVFNEYEIAGKRIASISTALHTITFTTTLRTDALSPTGAQQEPRIDLITVATPTGIVLRKFQFAHDYSTGRLTLKHVYEQDAGGVSLPPYSFTYDPTTLPATGSNAIDHWGFYNGKTSNTTTVPTVIAYGTFPLIGADREPDTAYARVAALARITYPTGGYNEFVYEPNDYGVVGTDTVTLPKAEGPLQFAATNSWTGNGEVQFTIGGTDSVIVKAYATQSPGDCWGQFWPPCPMNEIVGVPSQWQDAYAIHYVVLAPGTYTLRSTDAGSYPEGWATVSIEWRDRLPTKSKVGGGLRVAEVRTADAMGAISIRKYKYRLQSDSLRSSGIVNNEPKYAYSVQHPLCSYFSRASVNKSFLGSGPAVAYREVTVWHGANGEFGKTRHTFRSMLEANDPPAEMAFLRQTDLGFQRGQEKNSTEFNASGQIQQVTGSSYAFPLRARFQAMSTYFVNISGGYAQPFGQFFSNGIEILSSWTQMVADSTIVYNEAGTSSIVTSRAHAYGNPAHGQLTQLTETNSSGTQRITRMKYPLDYATGSGNAEAIALTAMQGAANIHGPVIERWVTEKVGSTETAVQAEVTSFKLYTSGQYLPYQRFVFNNPTGVTNFVPSAVTSGSFTKDSRYLLQETANTYDGFGRLTQLADARNNLTNYGYGVNPNGGNPNDAFLQSVGRVGSPTLTTYLGYHNTGTLAWIQDDGGSVKYFVYDAYGRLASVYNQAVTKIRAYGYTYSRTSPSWTFNPASPNAIIDSTFVQPGTVLLGTQYVDGLGRPIQSVVKDGTNYHVTATQYDLMGRSWRTWKPYTRTTAGYDASFTTNATSWYNTYHATSNAKPYVETAYSPDALARVKQVTPEYIGTSPTAFTTYVYGVDVTPKQTFTEVTDESGKKTRTYTDIFGNSVKTILGYGAAEATTTQLAYNVLGQRTQATDPRSLNTTYALNTRGLLTSRTSPDAGTAQSKYDKAGYLRYSQDANDAAAGKVAFTNYDVFNRPLVSGRGTATFASLDPDGAPPTLETTQGNWLIVRAYDAKPGTGTFPWTLFSTQITGVTLNNVTSRLTATASLSNGSWQVTLFSYDTDGRVATRHIFTHANGGTTVLTAINTRDSVVRDLRDAVTQRLLTVGSNTFNHWTDYNSRGLFWMAFASTGSTKPGTSDVTDTYRPGGQPQDYQFAGGPLVPLTYTIREQLATIGNTAVTTYPFSANYGYQPNGTVAWSQFHSTGSPAAAKRYTYNFTYDALNRLKTADLWTWNGTGWTSTLAHDLAGINYDAAGNLSSLQRYRETATLIDNLTYTYPGGSNRLSSVTDAVSTTAETWDAETGSFTYDANGNVATAPAPYSITAITYNAQNLPTSLTRSGTTTTYRYDDAGQRITKQTGAGNREHYIRDGATTLAVFTVNGSGTPVSWYFNVFAESRIIGRQPNTGNRRYYHFDMLGSTRAVVEGATVVESYDFEPWGLLMPGRTLGSGTKEGFTGKEQDSETGLDYFGARYYMPALGRWATVDPLAHKYAEWSPYQYTLNNPLVLIDPDGRQVSANPTTFMNLSHSDLQYLQTNAAALGAGRMQVTYTNDLEFSRNMDALVSAGANAYLTLLVIGASFTPADGLVSTIADVATGNFSLRNTGLNFLPGPGGSKIDDVIDVGRAGPYSHLPDHPSVGPGQAYTRKQKSDYLAANEARNSGTLRDDRTGEALVRPTKHQRGVTPPSNEAHVDHRKPKSKGGPNSSANAEVRSRRNNLAKGDKEEP